MSKNRFMVPVTFFVQALIILETISHGTENQGKKPSIKKRTIPGLIERGGDAGNRTPDTADMSRML